MGEANCVYVCVVDGAMYLVDGYHRIEAVVEAEMPVNIRVVVIQCQTMRDVAVYYSIYNRQTRGRTAAQVRGAYEVFDPESKVSKGLQGALYKSIPFILTGFSNTGQKHLPPEMKTDAFMFTQSVDWVGACEKYQEAMDKRTYRAVNKKFLNPSVVGVAVIILRYNESLGMEFWGAVFDYAQVPAGDPRRVLHDSINSRTDKSAKTPKGLACMVEIAWRKFLAGEQGVQVLRVSDHAVEKEFSVAQTPYKPMVS